jgi:type VII secretion-associated serine protease mycosin
MQKFARRAAAHVLALSFVATSAFVVLSTTVLALALDSTTSFAATGGDPLLDQQWGLTAIGAPSVWSVTRGAGITVAVIDSGSGPHPDLDANLDAGRTMFGSIDSVGVLDIDNAGHGSHVAGIIAAVANNAIGGSGVAPQSRILPIRVLDAQGSGDSKDVSKAVRYAVDSGTKVINLSLGGATESTSLTAAIQYAVDRNVLVVAAAGNGAADSPPKWPAASDLALAVTAVDRNNSVTSFDQRGDYIDLAAPGTSILSTASNDYKIQSGTSMAAAFVTGAAALLFAAQPSITAAQVRDVLQRTATDIGAPGRDTTFGYGLINLVAAFAELDVMFPKIITASHTTEGHVGAFAIGTASTSLATATSQWYRCTAPGEATTNKPLDCSAITNAVAVNYQSTVKDLRKFLRYSVTTTSGLNGSISSTYFSATTIPESGAWITTSTISAKTKTPLNELLRSPSKGTRTFKVINGSCKLRNSALVAPAVPGVCTLKVSIAAKAPFPTLGFTTIITVS